MHTLLAIASIASFSFLACVNGPAKPLGQFSVSLAVKDLGRSRTFYEGLGFAVDEHVAGNVPGYGTRWVIMRAGDAVVGLFQGAFDRNTLTFNPTDVHAVQEAARSRGITFQIEAKQIGPGFAMTTDPDGNPILLDQH